jgi:hypothetical protein
MRIATRLVVGVILLTSMATTQAAVVFDQSTTGGGGIFTQGFIVAEDFQLTAPSTTLRSFRVLLWDSVPNNIGTLDGFDGTLGWAIYGANINGGPGTLLSMGSATPILTDTGQQIQNTDLIRADANFSPEVVLGPGVYWLGVREGAFTSAPDGTQLSWATTSAPVGSAAYRNTDEQNPSSGNWSEATGFHLAFSLSDTAVPEPSLALAGFAALGGMLCRRPRPLVCVAQRAEEYGGAA